jgi:allantoicase
MNDFLQLADLASERLSGRVIDANDDFFAPKENLLKQSKPAFVEGKYTSRGKWMDGWETRRRRTPGHDWCIVRLGLPGIIRGVVVDTSFFTGNYPERFSLEGCDLGGQRSYKSEKKRLSSPKQVWVQILPETALKGDSPNLFSVQNENRFTHLRLKIHPDGGVARLRVHGEGVPDTKRTSRAEIDLAAVENGAHVVASSDQFYGAPRNLLMPYRAKNMSDGWETKRRRGPGHDWVVLKLGLPGTIRRIEVNTAHYKGNFPDTCSLGVCNNEANALNATNVDSVTWQELLPKTKLKPNHRHVFNKLHPTSVTTHARFNIYPDGGVSRLRLFGRAEITANPIASLERFNRLSKEKAAKALLDCCGSIKWAKQMAEQRPFFSPSALYEAADKIWSELPREDWLEAFRHHPAIGAKKAKSKQSATASRWSAKEQSTAQSAAREVLSALAEENRAYAKKYRYVFLICATGKTSEDILKALRQRMSNEPEVELRIAAEEQRKITRLRLEKLLQS